MRIGNDFHSWLVKIIAESPHSWQKIVIHGNSCIILYFMNENICILIQNSLKFVLKGPIDNNLALVRVMARRQTGHKSLPEPMLTQFTDAYMRHKGEMS